MSTLRYRTFNTLHRSISLTFDAALNIDTGDQSRARVDRQKGFPHAALPGRYDDAIVYRGVNYLNLWRLERTLRLRRRDVFVDVGCGKGRVVCWMARRNIAKAVGIDIDPELCAAAEQNTRSLRGRRTPSEIRCADAATADYDEGTVFFFYHPFGVETWQAVLRRLHSSWLAHPRPLRLVYYHAEHADLLRAQTWLTEKHRIATVTGYPILTFVARRR
jgi:SAM-dependent methyltransferase